MFRPTKSGVERLKQIEYLKSLIRDAFSNVDREGKGYVIREEISSLMRYFGQFPSEAQVVDVILPEIQEDEPTNYVYYDKFEKYMLNAIITNEYRICTSFDDISCATKIGKVFKIKDIRYT